MVMVISLNEHEGSLTKPLVNNYHSFISYLQKQVRLSFSVFRHNRNMDAEQFVESFLAGRGGQRFDITKSKTGTLQLSILGVGQVTRTGA